VASAVKRLKESVGDNSKIILGFTVNLKNKDMEAQLETLFTNVNKGSAMASSSTTSSTQPEIGFPTFKQKTWILNSLKHAEWFDSLRPCFL
jgi:hypothetical protein